MRDVDTYARNLLIYIGKLRRSKFLAGPEGLVNRHFIQ